MLTVVISSLVVTREERPRRAAQAKVVRLGIWCKLVRNGSNAAIFAVQYDRLSCSFGDCGEHAGGGINLAKPVKLVAHNVQ